MRTTSAVIYAVCDCGKEVRTPEDGIIVRGALYAGAPVGDAAFGNIPDTKPIIGTQFLDRDTYPEEEYRSKCEVPVNAMCWDCLFKKVTPPVVSEYKKLKREAEEEYSRRINAGRTDW